MSSSTGFGFGTFGTSPFGTSPFFNCAELITNVLEATGHSNPSLETAKRAALVVFMNNSYQEICLARQWPWMHASYDFRFQAKYNTGTVSVTQGSATVTGDGTVWDSTLSPGCIFSLESTGKIYHVLSVESTTSLTLETLYSEDSSSSESYTIAKNQYLLPAEVDYPTTLSIDSTMKMIPVSPDELRLKQSRLGPLTGLPRFYSFIRRDYNNDGTFVEVWPAPENYYNLSIDYKIRILKLSDTSDEYPIIPDRYRAVLYYGMLYQFYQYLRKPDDMANSYSTYLGFLRRMENDFKFTDGQMSILPSRNYLRRPSASYDVSYSLQEFASLPSDWEF